MTAISRRARFCQACGSGLTPRTVETEGRERLVCAGCGFIHYVNPRVVAGLIPEHDGRALLVRRAIEPSHGLWTFPGGYLELGETAEQGAEREALEEAGLALRAGPLLGAYTLVGAGIVVVVFRAALVSPSSPRPAPGPEVLEAAWFRPSEVPWPDLAFETTAAALRDWVKLAQPGSPPDRQAR